MAEPQGQAEVPTKFSAEFKDFAKYLFFLGVFCAVIFGPKNSDPYYMRQSLDDMFLGHEYDYGISYGDTASLAQVWQWVDSIVLPNLYPEAWYAARAYVHRAALFGRRDPARGVVVIPGTTATSAPARTGAP
jgi:hypothetical protein